MDKNQINYRLEKATHLINEIRFAENILDQLFFSQPTISVAPPPVNFFQNYTQSAYKAVQTTNDTYQEKSKTDLADFHLSSNSNDTKNTDIDTSDRKIEYPDYFCEIIGKRIRERRLSIGITQNELSYSTGIKRPNIARLEKGQTLPNLSTLLKVSSALQISLEQLLKV